MTGRNQPMTVGTSTSADLNRQTGRLTPSRRRKSFRVSIHTAASGSLSRMRMFLTHQQLRVNLAEKKATPSNQTAASNGATCPRRALPPCHNESMRLPRYELWNPPKLEPGRAAPVKVGITEGPEPSAAEASGSRGTP